MKKVFLILACALTVSIATAQSTTPRQGNLITLKIATNDAAGADTIKFTPTEWRTILSPSSTITDTLCYMIKDISRCHLGDEIVCSVTNSSGSGNKIKFVGFAYPFAVSGSDTVIALTASKRAVIKFMFNGATWVETSKIVQ